MSRDGAPLLVHPVYLDVPMMVSFVAAIEGGFAFSEESTSKSAGAGERTREVAGRSRLSLPGLASLVGMDMSGRLQSTRRDEESEEVKVVRQHTEASLFNLLRNSLVEAGRLTTIESAEQLDALATGDLVELQGEVVGNPLQQMLDLFLQIMPYVGVNPDELLKPKKPKSGGRSGNPAKAAGPSGGDVFSDEDLLRLFATMRSDLEAASVRDVVLLGPQSLRAVLTLSTEFFTKQTVDYLLGGRFMVIGKVTRVLADDDVINLTRRTALGLGGPAVARQLVADFKNEQELFVEIEDPVVEPPGLQVLPLALFV